MVDQGREGRGLPRAGGTAHQHEAVLEVGQARHQGGQAELPQVGQDRPDDAEDGPYPAELLEHIDTEAQVLGLDSVREVDFPAGVQILELSER